MNPTDAQIQMVETDTSTEMEMVQIGETFQCRNVECSREILILRPCPRFPSQASGPEVMDKISGTF